MMINKVIVCPICNKKTFLRIQDGGYLNEYPIRINCYNCRALMKGIYVMQADSSNRGLRMVNAQIEECDMDSNTLTCKNADYVAEVSGELPCDYVKIYSGGLPTSPFLKTTGFLDSVEKHIARLKYFNMNIEEWKRKKSTAFQLLDDGSIEYIALALENKMGDYYYECDHYLKSIQCLQEVVLEETKDVFLLPSQDDYVRDIISNLALVDKELLHQFAEQMGGVQKLISAYRKTIEAFSEFMKIYPNLLPAETFMNFKNTSGANTCIATCTFADVKTFYQDAYESLLSLLYIPVCLDNIVSRGDFQSFSQIYDNVKCHPTKSRDFAWYKQLDNGTRINKLDVSEKFQKLISFPANRFLRNGIGHNNIKYDSITQIVTAYDLKNPEKIRYQESLMHVAIECLGLARSIVAFSEMILFILRSEFKRQGIRSIIHPRFYVDVQPNDRCPCGSDVKYKKCCRNDIDKLIRGKL